MTTAICVDPKRINEVWPHVAHLIRQGYEAVSADDRFETTEKEILNGDALLWLAVDDGKILAAAATKIWKSETKKICSVLSVSGHDLSDWKDCLRSIETYAKNEGCEIVRLSGREGWKRIFTDYEQPWIVLEKRL